MEAEIRLQRQEVALSGSGPRFEKIVTPGASLSKSGSDLGPVSLVKELLRGSRTGCQYR
jgi:hypothetical protein